jgi:hypothetical protein
MDVLVTDSADIAGKALVVTGASSGRRETTARIGVNEVLFRPTMPTL